MRNWIILVENALPPLPTKGATPWWVEPLQELTQEVVANDPEWGWTNGGCFTFAEVLAKAYGGKCAVIIVWDDRADDWWNHHAIVEINGVYYDYNGVFVMPKRGDDGHKRAKIVPPDSDEYGYQWMDEMHLDDDQLERLNAVFNQ